VLTRRSGDGTSEESAMDDTRAACASGIRTLTDWAARVAVADVPVPVLERAARVLADDLGAIVGARDEPEVACFHKRLLARAAMSEATVFRGGRARTDRLSAAVANAVAGDWLELDEGYRVTPCHAGLYVVPALLAEAEARDLPLRDMLRALAVAYEVVTRVARAFSPRVLNLHSHARYAAVGASAATSLAAGTTPDLMHAALTAAATLINVGPRNHLLSGALVRNVWPAVGAWSGMMSVEWAQCGIMGAIDGVHDVYTGLLDSDTRPQALTHDLGHGWAILDGYMKVFACCQHLHSAVDAVLQARPQVIEAGGYETVDTIAVEAHALALLLPNPRPATTLAAKFSLPHTVAAALVTGSGGADAFASDTLHNPAIAHLRERVVIAPYAPLPAPPNDRPAQVRVRLHDGRTFEAQCLSAQGGPDRPFPPAVLASKLAALAAPVYPRLPDVLSKVLSLDATRMEQGWAAIVADFCA
jgi:2-methylcitrate dehydratase PrpD